MAGKASIDVATRAAGLNVLLQVLLRVSTFVLNGVVLRYVEASLLGVVNLRLTLLYDTVLFLSREALRKTGLSKTTGRTEWSHTANLMWCCFPAGIVCSLLLGTVWVSPLINQPNVDGDLLGVVVFCLAALVELAVEPVWVLAQINQHVTLKVLAEALAHVGRCLVIVVGVTMATEWGGLLPFCAGQLTFSLSYALIYYGYFTFHLSSHSHPHSLPIRTLSHILPSPAPDKTWFGKDALTLSWSFFKQSFLKQFLTNGERYVMTVFGVLSFAQQGVYDIIHNLGSMVARFIFLPIEENFYVFFASVLYRGEPPTRQREGAVDLSASTLTMLLKFVLHVALAILCFGYSYSFLALDIYGGSLLSDGEGPTLLRWYCAYVFTLAVNGVTECFVFAAMSQSQVDSYNRMMLVFSVVFLFATLLLTRLLGSVGFILANCVNMITRITHSCHFIHKFFHGTPHTPLTSSLPSLPTCLTFLTAFIITTSSEYFLCCDRGWEYRLLHVVVGAVTMATVAGVVVTTERELLLLLAERLPVRLQGLLRRLGVVTTKTE